MSGINEKISHAEDWAALSYCLESATESDIAELKPLIPELIRHTSWVVRCDLLEIIQDFSLSEYLDLVKEGLNDRVIIVRGYALEAYYGLLGKKALGVIQEFCKGKNVRLRVTALALCYVETRDEEALGQIERILTRKGCSHYHQYVVYHCFEEHGKSKEWPEIIELYKKILKSVPKSRGIAKDLRKRLKEK
ncbi:MAG: hypothetical protein ACYS8Z_08685 [Planctomycetota bacterium]